MFGFIANAFTSFVQEVVSAVVSMAFAMVVNFVTSQFS
jgi:hypothetical protein